MKRFRLACVGLGHRGRSMVKAVAESIGCIQVVALCDIQPALYYDTNKTSVVSSDHPFQQDLPDVHFYEDYDEMLEKEDLDVVMVETPATCHAEFCAKALRKGIHVFSDIPSVASLEEADYLWKAQQDSPAMLMTGATTMGWGFVIAMQDLYQKGLLGKPFYLEAEYIHDCRYLWEETPWRRPGNNNHRYPITYCTHSLGPLLSLIDEDLKLVTCLSTGSHVTDVPEAEDLNTATYQTPSGIIVRNTNSFINNCKFGNHSYRVFGTEGYFEHISSRGDTPAKTRFSSQKAYGSRAITEIPIGFAPYEDGKWAKNGAGAFGHGGADAHLWHLFADALEQGAKVAPIDLRAGLRMTLPGIYAMKSIQQHGAPVKIYYPWDEDWSEAFR